MPQLSTLRLILNAAVLAAAGPTLLSQRASLTPCGPVEKEDTQTFSVHAGGCTQDGGEKRNVLIVIMLLQIATKRAIPSKTQRTIGGLGM
jgi:hypothetical protein